MKVLVCGSRDMPLTQQKLVLDELRATGATHVIQGGARGADFMGKLAGLTLGCHVDEFPADWDTHGKSAGPIRNQKMLDQKPDLVLAFHPTTGITRGTNDMVTRSTRAGVEVKIVMYEEDLDT